MKKARYTDSQIINILKQASSGIPAPDLCQEHGMSPLHFINGEQHMAAWTLL